MLCGETKASPYAMNHKNACTYCPYGGVCGFDEKIPGYAWRYLKNQDWSALRMPGQENEEEADGATMDSRTETGH